jgi:hypothetical protein
LLGGSYIARSFQCPSKERIFGFLGQCYELIAILAVDLKSITDSIGLLPEYARAARAPYLHLLFNDHDKPFNQRLTGALAPLPKG